MKPIFPDLYWRLPSSPMSFSEAFPELTHQRGWRGRLILMRQRWIGDGHCCRRRMRSSNTRDRRLAWGTTVKCGAVCCYCPSTMMNRLILTVYKVAKGFCKKLIRKKKWKELIMHRKALLVEQQERRRTGMRVNRTLRIGCRKMTVVGFEILVCVRIF